TADRAWSAIKRMGSATVEWGKKTFGPQSRVGAFGALAEGYSVIAPVRAYADFEDIARRAAITKGLSGAAVGAETKRLMSFFQRDALETGQSSQSVAEAYLDLIQSGLSPKLSEKLLPIHSRA